MKEKIFIINFFDKEEMKWYEKEVDDQNHELWKQPLDEDKKGDDKQFKYRNEAFHNYHEITTPAWFLEELGKQPPKLTLEDGLKLEDYFEEQIQLTPIVQLEKYKEFEEIEEIQVPASFLENEGSVSK